MTDRIQFTHTPPYNPDHHVTLTAVASDHPDPEFAIGVTDHPRNEHRAIRLTLHEARQLAGFLDAWLADYEG